MKRQQPIAITIFSALCFISAPLVGAAIGVAAILYGLEVGLGLHTTPVWIGRLAAAPILYLVWLLLLLSLLAIEMQGWRRFLGYHKPARVSERDNRFQFYLIMMCYMRQRIVWQLPLAQTFLIVEGLRHLVLWGSAPRVRLGTRGFLLGLLYDPDLIEIGDGVVLGTESFVVAHSITTTPDGGRVYSSAPVRIGQRAVVGGQSRIDLGVQIGADALVEPMSYVAPFTIIGAGEVWGGNPARFLRARFDAPAQSIHAAGPAPTPATAPERSTDLTLRQIVATVLDLPLADVTPGLTADECAAWDSLAQMGIASALQQQLGVVVPIAERFRLRSMADLRDLLRRSLPAEPPTADTPPAPALPRNPELLPLLDHELITNSLAAQQQAPLSDNPVVHELPVVIAATFTAEPVASALKLWSQAFGISPTVQFADYNQIPQTLLSDNSAFARNLTGINVVLARPEDLLAGHPDSHETALHQVLDAIARFGERRPGSLVVGTLPPVVSPFASLDRHAVQQCRARWHSRLEQTAGVELLDFAGVVEWLGIDAARNVDMEVVARAPYSAALYRELGIEIARTVRRRVKPPAKVLALDADGVLWGGVLAEDGMDGVHLGPDHPGRAFHLFQQQVLQLKQRGILLVLVSRNVEDDVWRMVDDHPEMQVRRGDIAGARINWHPKSQNLHALAAELNLGLDAFVFIDDDPANRMEVEAHAPGVVVVPMPADATQYCEVLSRLWCFDSTTVTAEDLARTAMIRQEQVRQDGVQAAGGMESYLASLGLVVEMRLAAPGDLPRVAQLTQKTNQFNLSLTRRTLPEIQALTLDSRVYVIRAHDRFGEYGLVGVCVLRAADGQPGHWDVDTLLLSCRALGRGVEDAVLYGAAAALTAEGATQLIARFVAGPRNQPLRDFLMRKGFQERSGGVFEHHSLSELALPAHITFR